MFLANLSLKRPVFSIVVIIAMLVVGIVSYKGLAINQYPNTDSPVALITINMQGTSPDQMESKITTKVEEAVGQISGVKHITSTVSEGSSVSSLEFDFEKDSNVAIQEIKDKINSIRGTLPQDIDEPIIQKMDMGSQAIMSFVVTGNLSNRDMSSLVEDSISKRLKSVTGVGSVIAYGDQEREIQIQLDNEKLISYGLTTSEVSNSIQNDNTDVSSGKLSNGDQEISLRTDGKIKAVNDFLDIIIANRAGTEIRLRDIAKVEDAVKERTSISYYKGKEAIGIDVVKQSGENTTEVADDIKVEVESIRKTLPSGVTIETVDDNSVAIRDSVNEVKKTMIEGCLLAIVIVFLFLRNWGSTITSAISLPTSIITTFAAMKVMNFTLNTMSLMGLSLAVGLLVDDAIVVIENIIRHLHMGKSPIQAAKDGTSEIGLAVMATTFTVVAVFLPVSMVNGMIGQYFKQFGITVAASVLVSLFVSFTLVPLMASRYISHEEKTRKGPVAKFLAWFNGLFDKLALVYSRVLAVTLRHRIMTISITVAMFFGSLMLIPTIGVSFMESTDDGKITVTAELDGGTTLDSAAKTAKSMEAVLYKYPEVKYLYTTVTASKISIVVKLPDKKERKDSISDIGARMRENLNKIPGIDLSIQAGAGFMSGKTAQYNFTGNDFEQVKNYALKAMQILKQIPGAVDVSINYKAGNAEAKLVVDRDKAADLGISSASVANTLSTFFNGAIVSHYETGKDRYDVRLLLKEEQRADFDSLKSIYIPNSKGEMISLDQVTKKVFSTSSNAIHRYDKLRNIQVTANVVGTATSTFNTKYTNMLLQKVEMPKGVRQFQGGMAEMQGESTNQLLLAFVMGILFIFLILAAQFESFIDPLAILFSLPFAITGALLGLLVGHKNLGLMAGIGIIMLMGLVTKNAILLIDFTKQRRREGTERTQAILQAGTIRLRPIMMTTLAMIFGMLPTAVATGTGSESRTPMAFAIIGGLIVSTILTLVVVPVAYTLLDDFKGLFIKKVPKIIEERI